MDLNRLTILGYVTADIELKKTQSGTSFANFSVATNKEIPIKEGEVKKEVCFHDCSVFGKKAETLAQYAKKGSRLLAEGWIKQSSYEKDGVKHYRKTCMVEQFIFLDKKDKSNSLEAEISIEDVPF